MWLPLFSQNEEPKRVPSNLGNKVETKDNLNATSSSVATMLDDGRSYASSTTMLSSNQKTSMSSKDENQSNYMKSPAFNESIKTE